MRGAGNHGVSVSILMRFSAVSLRSCQAFLEEQHPEQDARGSQGSRIRYSSPRVSYC
jgi:hypothetical protein